MLNRLLRLLESFLWPRALYCPGCLGCTEGGLLCPACEEELKQRRLREQHGFVRSTWPYDGCVRNLIISLKYDCVEDCAKILADGMAETVRGMDLPANTLMTWVTMPEDRLRQRGIDHGRILCEQVSMRTGLPVKQLLIRRRKGHTQRGLSRKRRLQNLKGAFNCVSCRNRPVLLVDDVLTTGATTEVCTQELLKAGAKCVYVLTAARVAPLKKRKAE